MKEKIHDFLTKKYKCNESAGIFYIIPLVLAFFNIFGIDTFTKSGQKNEASFTEGLYLLGISLAIYRIFKYKGQGYIIYKCRDCEEVFDERKLKNDSKHCIFCHSQNIIDVKDYY